MTKLFNMPYREHKVVPDGGGHHLWKIRVGQSVYRASGTFYTRESVPTDTLAAADPFAQGDASESAVPGRYAWVGGHVYTVSDAVGAELVAAGYEVI